MPVKKRYPVPEDIEIAQEAELLPITEVAKKAGILEEELEPFGKYIAKVDYAKVLERLKERPNGKLVTITAITPTPLGEGKTVTAFGLGQALSQKGIKIINTFREPSKGPTFGIKGGACGGGYSQALPMENINLNFTGDIHACESAHNLCASAIDAHIFHGNKLGLDPENISWTYCQDLNSRALREAVVGLGGKTVGGYPRRTNFDITVATETAAIIALTTGLKDLRERFRRVVVGYTRDNKPITAEDLQVSGAMTALLIEAIKPNLVQSTEGHPMLCHGFPFANVAHGNNSNMANMVALKLADLVVTESGFGADCGFTKLVDVGCRQSGVKLDGAVIVASIRALKQHGGAFHLRPGVDYSRVKEEAEMENLPALEKGCENLKRNIEIVKEHGVKAIVAINKFPTDTDKEIELVRQKSWEFGADGVAVSDVWAKGGEGGMELADAVLQALEKPSEMKFTFPDEMQVADKIRAVATKVHGAEDVEFSPAVWRKIKLFEELGFGWMTVNMAKTHLSLSHDPNWLGVPSGYKLPVRDIRASVGAGFFYPICGTMMTMPGLPSRPAFEDVDVDVETGRIKGLF